MPGPRKTTPPPGVGVGVGDAGDSGDGRNELLVSFNFQLHAWVVRTGDGLWHMQLQDVPAVVSTGRNWAEAREKLQFALVVWLKRLGKAA